MQAQIVTISGPTEAEVGISEFFTAEWEGSPQEGYVFDHFKWDASFLGSSGSIQGTLEGYYYDELPYTDASNPSSVEIIWGEEHPPVYAEVSVKAFFIDNNGNQYFAEGLQSVYIYGVCAESITGPSKVQKCCLEPVTYCVQNYCDGNLFDWSWPSNWTLLGSDNGSCITLMPDKFSGGNVSCTVRRSQSVYEYFRSNTKSISRTEPEIVLSSPFPKDTLCRKNQYTYKIEPLCGANNYEWYFPDGWNILSGQGSTEVLVEASVTAQSGEVNIVATFPNDFCGPTIAQAYLHLLDPPPTPVVYPGNTSFPEYSSSYHCGEWWICSGNQWQDNTIRFAEVDQYVEYMEWELIPTTPGGSTQWHFEGSNSNTMVTTGRQYFSPLIQGPEGAGPGKLKVKVINYCGQESYWSTVIDFNEQTGFWCENSYPIWCECCTPDPNLPPMATMPNETHLIESNRSNVSFHLNEKEPLQIRPNPFDESFELIFTPEFSVRKIEIIDTNGQIILQRTNLSDSEQIQLNGQADGLYFLRVYSLEGIQVKKLFKLRAR